MTARYFFILTLLLLMGICYASPSRRLRSRQKAGAAPVWMGDHCTKDSDCNSGECCIYRPDRYSIPECRSLEKENENCIPSAPTLNTTLYYPDGSQLELFDVHRILCPCVQQSRCNKEGVCSSNDVIEEPVHHDD